MHWKNEPKRKPLLLYGARQTGKTHLLKTFGKEQFKELVYFDLEKQASVRAAFDGDLEPAVILQRLSQLHGSMITQENTLVVLDEIQRSNRALTSLKYFNEEMPGIYLVGAGSLLGVAINREEYSAPVGGVDTLTLYPMTFDEYLEAMGQSMMVEAIAQCYASDTSYFLHEQALEYFWQFLLVGGMPEAVAEYSQTGDLAKVGELQSTISDLYVADMAKYATPYETAQIMEVWDSIPAQLAKSNKKFQYKMVRQGGRKSRYQGAISWLLEAGLVNKCTQITSGQAPLKLQEDSDSFKVYVGDTGLLSGRLHLPPHVLNSETRKMLDMGAIIENYVAQALTANGFDLRYWVSSGKAEVDFVIEDGAGHALPLEVKSSDNVRSRSMAVYREKYLPLYSMRLSTKNFGFVGGIKSVPLYAAWCLQPNSK